MKGCKGLCGICPREELRQGRHILDKTREGAESRRPRDLILAQDRILASGVESFGADLAVLYSFNPITGNFHRPWRAAGELRSVLQEPRVVGFTQKVLQTGHIFVEDVDRADLASSTFVQQEGIRSFAALCLKGSRWAKPLGVLYLDFRQARSFSGRDRAQLEAFAKEAFGWLETPWLLARYREASRISAEINQDLRTRKNLFATLDRHLSGVLDTHYFFSIGVFSWRQQELDLYYRFREQDVEQTTHPGLEIFSTLEAEPYVASWTGQRPGFALVPARLGSEFAPGSYLLAPLILRKVLLGFICAVLPQKNGFDDEDERVISLVAQYVSSALNNIRLFRNLRRLSKAGQFLAESLGEEEGLQRVVDEILAATQADVVVLYPYHAKNNEFRLPPKLAGKLLDPDFPQPLVRWEDDPPGRVLSQNGPRYFIEAGAFGAEADPEAPPAQLKFQVREEIASLATVPLRSQGGLAGVLFLNYRRNQPFDSPQRRLIEGLAYFAAAALHNARRFIEAGTRRAHEHAIIQKIDTAIDQTGDHRTVLKEILKGANDLLKADAAAILLWNPGEPEEAGGFFAAEAIGRHSEATRGWSTYDSKSGILDWILTHRSPVLINDLPSDPNWRALAANVRPGTRSELDVPLLVGEEVVGVLNFESTEPGHFSEADQEFLLVLSKQVLIAVGRARETELAQQEATDRKLLMDLTHAIIGETDLEKLLPLILEQALEMTQAEAGVIFLYDEERKDLEIRFEKGTQVDNRGVRFLLDEGIVGHVARNKTSLNIDPREQPWAAMYREFFSNTCSELAVPLLAGESLRGVLNLESTSPKRFRHRAQRLTEDLASLATIALRNAESLKTAQTELARFNVLAEAGEKLGSLAELGQLNEAYQTVLNLAVGLCGGLVVMRKLNLAEGKFVVAQAAGEPGRESLFETMKLDEGLNGQAYTQQKLQYKPDLHTERGKAKPADGRFRSLLVAPVKLGDKYYGNLGATHTSPYHYNEADRRMFEGLAQLLAITHNRLEVIQEKQELEKAKEQSEILGWMGEASFQIAHRLGNRLGAVTARLNQIEDRLSEVGIRDEKVDGYLQRVRTQTQLVLELGDGLDEAVRKLEGRKPRSFCLQDLARDLVRRFGSLSDDISVMLVPGDADLWVFAAQDQVFDILENLLQNSVSAIGHAGANPGRIEIRISKCGAMARVDVVDNGCGIPEKNWHLIFSFLYSTKGNYQGMTTRRHTGFGLWSGLRQARLNGGDLLVSDSQEGKGSTLTLTLPLAAYAAL